MALLTCRKGTKTLKRAKQWLYPNAYWNLLEVTESFELDAFPLAFPIKLKICSLETLNHPISALQMWKKSGAWFYREMPLPPPSRPCSAMAGPSMIANGTPPFMSGGGNGQPGSPTTRSVGSHTGPMPRRQLEQIRQESRERDRERANRRVEPIPIPAEQQQRSELESIQF